MDKPVMDLQSIMLRFSVPLGIHNSRIANLEEKLKIATSALEFYGNKENWLFSIDGREEGYAARQAIELITKEKV